MSALDLHFPAPPVRREGQVWAACGEGKCQCGQIWDLEGDSPILKVLRKNEEEGVTYPAELVERNARLAEAAPELLATLKRVVEWNRPHMHTPAPFREAEALLARLDRP